MGEILKFPSNIDRSFQTKHEIQARYLPDGVISLQEERQWKKISGELIESEKYGIAEKIAFVLKEYKTQENRTAQIIPFPKKKRA